MKIFEKFHTEDTERRRTRRKK